MTARLLNGKELADKIKTQLKNKTALLNQAPKLAIILVGDNEASGIYVRNKLKAAKSTGIDARLFKFPSDVQTDKILQTIETLNTDSQTNGIIIQLPLPEHLPTQQLLAAITPEKDVDGFHPLNAGLLQNGNEKAFIPATARGIMALIDETTQNLKGKNALVIGRSRIVGKPVAQLLLNRDCTVTIAHSKTQNLPALTQTADIVVAACGQAEMVKADWLKDGAVVIDVGINRLQNRLCGDVDFANAVEKASFITPVPGGVGPMTIAMLLQNTYDAYLKQKNT